MYKKRPTIISFDHHHSSSEFSEATILLVSDGNKRITNRTPGLGTRLAGKKMAELTDDLTNFDEEEFYKQLLLEETRTPENLNPDRHEFVPKPGYVMKLRNSQNEKVFINVCTSDKVPVPKDVSDQELAEILQSVDPTQYRVPMSLGEPHAEVDNKGQGLEGHIHLFICDVFYGLQPRVQGGQLVDKTIQICSRNLQENRVSSQRGETL